LSASSSYHEKEIIRLIIQGDESAFEALYRHYRHRTYTLALTYMNDPAQAEDVLQEFFLKIWKVRLTLEKIDRFDLYLFTALRNQLISELRKKDRQQKIKAYLSRENAWQPTAEQMTESRELHSAIREALQQLPEKQQTIYRMSREEGLNHEEIASRLQLSPRTISNLLSLTLNHLRTSLRAQGYLPGTIVAATLFFY
jgi:RNA polymerase sigma-70 factor (family 1)